MGELLPCPFCGSEAEIIVSEDDDGRFAAVSCPKCGAGSRQHYFCGEDAREFAADAWNTRPRTEGRGEGQPVAWRVWCANGEYFYQTEKPSAFSPSHVQPLYASPIREPEISRGAVIEAIRQHVRTRYERREHHGAYHFSGLEAAADAILNLAPVAKGASKDAELSDEFDRPGRLSDATRHSAEGAADPALSGARGVVAPVGGRGEEGSSQSQPVLSPKSDTDGPSADGWVSVEDRFPGEQGFDSGNVLVFINGHCDLLDMTCRQGGAWGIRLGWFDVERQAFRVGGTVERQVTHWCDLPNPPERRAVDDGEADHTGQLRDEPSSSNLNEESQTNGS